MSAILKSMNSLLARAVELLPDSPFRTFIDQVRDVPYLDYLNWFIPFSDFIGLLSLWTVAIGLYYVVSAVLRTVNAID